MTIKYIKKDLLLEDQIKESIAYFPVAGESKMTNFRAPDTYVFIFFEKAQGWHSIDFKKHESQNNQLHISFPGEIHSWETKPGACGHKLILSKDYMKQILRMTKFMVSNTNNYPVIDISKESASRINQEFIILSEEINNTLNFQEEIINLRVRIILSLICNEINTKELQDPIKNISVLKFIQLVEQNYIESKTVSFYSEKVFVSANYLNIIVKKYLGMTAKEVIQARVLLEGKRLILGSKKSIKEIAFELGFSGIASFSTFFIKKIGISPSEFRNQNYSILKKD